MPKQSQQFSLAPDQQQSMEFSALDRAASGRTASSRSALTASGRRHTPVRPQVSAAVRVAQSAKTDPIYLILTSLLLQAAATLEAPPDNTTGKHEPLPKYAFATHSGHVCSLQRQLSTLLCTDTASTSTSQCGGLHAPSTSEVYKWGASTPLHCRYTLLSAVIPADLMHDRLSVLYETGLHAATPCLDS